MYGNRLRGGLCQIKAGLHRISSVALSRTTRFSSDYAALSGHKAISERYIRAVSLQLEFECYTGI